MSITYNLSRTAYPDQIDVRPGENPDPNNTDYFENEHFKININFEDRDGTTNPKDYYVLADDINALQESMIAVQRSLGVKPQGDTAGDTVSERLLKIENFVTYYDSLNSDPALNNLDERFMWGGARPSSNGTPVPLVSIVGHDHSGTIGQADKISLWSHVTDDPLRKINIDLDSGTTNMITAQDIKMSTSSSETISSEFNTKFDKSGGVITGDTEVKGKLTSRTFFEVDAIDTEYLLDYGLTVSVTDNKADSGFCRRAEKTATSSNFAALQKVNLRYGDYVLAARMKIDAKDSALLGSNICRLVIRDSYNHTLASRTFQIGDFKAAAEYQNMYLKFEHKNEYDITGTSRTEIYAMIYYYHGVENLSIDSMTINPLHIAVYDDDLI